MASIDDDVPATQNLLHDDEKDDVDVEGEGPTSQSLSKEDDPESDVTPSKRFIVSFKNDAFKNDAATKEASPSSPLSDGSDSDGDTSVGSLHEKPVDRRAMRRVMMKEFFVRAFLAKHFSLPPVFSTYEALMRLVTVEVYGTHEAVWQVNVKNKSVLIDFLVQFYREEPDWFYSLLIREDNIIIIRAKQQRLDTIVKAFLKVRN